MRVSIVAACALVTRLYGLNAPSGYPWMNRAWKPGMGLGVGCGDGLSVGYGVCQGAACGDGVGVCTDVGLGVGVDPSNVEGGGVGVVV